MITLFKRTSKRIQDSKSLEKTGLKTGVFSHVFAMFFLSILFNFLCFYLDKKKGYCFICR